MSKGDQIQEINTLMTRKPNTLKKTRWLEDEDDSYLKWRQKNRFSGIENLSKILLLLFDILYYTIIYCFVGLLD